MVNLTTIRLRMVVKMHFRLTIFEKSPFLTRFPNYILMSATWGTGGRKPPKLDRGWSN